MNELSDYRVVDDAAELAEPSATNGTNGAHSTNGAHPAVEDAAASVPSGVAPSDAVQSQQARTHLDSWGPDIPSMRLAPVGVVHDESEGQPNDAPASAPPPTADSDPTPRPPRLLRLARFVVGVLLLAGAWAATVAVLMLVQSLLAGPPQGMDAALQIVLYGLTALGAVWLALVALACLAAGAFALALALSARGW